MDGKKKTWWQQYLTILEKPNADKETILRTRNDASLRQACEKLELGRGNWTEMNSRHRTPMIVSLRYFAFSITKCSGGPSSSFICCVLKAALGWSLGLMLAERSKGWDTRRHTTETYGPLLAVQTLGRDAAALTDYSDHPPWWNEHAST